jgi:hypothetical protein
MYYHFKLKFCFFKNICIYSIVYIYNGILFYSAINKNEVLSFADKWMDQENTILSEVSQVQKAKGPMYSLIYEI